MLIRLILFFRYFVIIGTIGCQAVNQLSISHVYPAHHLDNLSSVVNHTLAAATNYTLPVAAAAKAAAHLPFNATSAVAAAATHAAHSHAAHAAHAHTYSHHTTSSSSSASSATAVAVRPEPTCDDPNTVPWHARREFLAGLVYLAITPLCMLKNMSALGFVSFLSLAAVVYLSVLVLQDSIHKFVVASTNHMHYVALLARSSHIGIVMNATSR